MGGEEMPAGLWTRRAIRGLGRRVRRPPPSRRSRETGGIPPVLVTLTAALVLAGVVIALFQIKLRPIVAQAAQAQVQNRMTAVIDQAVAQSLAGDGVGYGDLISIQRDETGTISALTADTGALNQLRLELVSQVLAALNEVDVSMIRVPLGSLVDSELVWARGPAIQARALSVGTVSAEFESEFTSAGVNQTLHRIWLELSVPLTVLLPGQSLETQVDTRICVGETVIVGQVPQFCLPGWDPAG